MAEPPLKGKHPSTKCKPSRLRNEVNPESTDDERASEFHTVQAPDSQVLVPETQLGYPEGNETDNKCPLSPGTAAMLDRNTVSKRAESKKPVDLTVNYLSRPTLSSESISTPKVDVRFQFGQPPFAAKKPPLRAEYPAAQSEIKSLNTQHAADRDAQLVPPPANLPDATADGLPGTPQHDDKCPTRELRAPVPSVLDSTGISGEEDRSREEPRDTVLDHRSFAQPGTELSDGKKKTRLIKKVKKGKKGQHRGVPWPPRPPTAGLAPRAPSPTTGTALEKAAEADMAEPQAVVKDDFPNPPSWSEVDHEQALEPSSRLPSPPKTKVVPRRVRTSRRAETLPPGAGRTPINPLPAKPARRSAPPLFWEDSMSNNSEKEAHDAQIGMQDGNEIVHEPQLDMQDGDEVTHGQQYSIVNEPYASPERGHRHVPETSSHLPIEQSNTSLPADFGDDATFHQQEENTSHLPVEHNPRKHPAPRGKKRPGTVKHSQRPSEQVQRTAEVSPQGLQSEAAHGEQCQEQPEGDLAHGKRHHDQVNGDVPHGEFCHQEVGGLAHGEHPHEQADGDIAHGDHHHEHVDGNLIHVGRHHQQVDRNLAQGGYHRPHVEGNLAHGEHHQQYADTVLHGISDLNGPYRVGKAQKRRRPLQQAVASASFQNPIFLPQTDFDKAWETVRTAYYADQSRKDTDIATQTKHFEEVKALLQNQIIQNSATIAEWKDKYAALNAVVVDFREKAKTNQKYVSGLQKDHEKIQKFVVTLRDECKKALKEKIAEVELEKQSLLRDLTAILEASEKSKKNSMKITDELYVELTISQSKRKDLTENLEKQVAMYEEERAKRYDLESRLLPSVQNVQRQLDDRSTQLANSLDTLRKSTDGAAARQGTDASINECVEILRKFEATPFLTSKDVEKSERMLRFVNDGLGKKLETLAESIGSMTDSTESIKAAIGNQLQELRSEMLKVDEAVAESRKNQDLNAALNTQLVAEREEAQEMNRKIEALSRQAEDLEEQKVQLERQLAEANDKFRDQNTDKSTLENSTEDLRRQLKLAGDDLSSANAEIERLEKNKKTSDKKIADYDISVQILKDACKELEQSNNPIELRKEIQKELVQEFSKKETGYRNDIHRLTNELEESKAMIQQHDKKMDAAKARCDDSRNAAQGLQSQLDVARKEKMEIEAKLKTLQLTVQSQSSNAAEVEGMKENLRKKTEELQEKAREHAQLEHTHAELEASKRNLLVSWEQQQTEISQHSSAIDSLRQEAEAERREEQSKSKIAIELAQSQARTLEKEKSDLQTKLEKARISESKLNDTHTALVAERDDLRTRNTELEAAKEVSATEISRAHEDKADTVRTYEERLNTARRDQERSDAALRDAEAKIQLERSQHHKKLEFDRQKYEEKYEDLVEAHTEELNRIKAQEASRHDAQRQTLPPTSLQHPALHSSQTMQTGKSRKKVSRENHTVLDVGGLSGTFASASAQGTARGRNQGLDQSDNLFDEEYDSFDGDKLDKDQGCSITDPAAVLVEETQDIGGVLPPFVEEIQDVSGIISLFVAETQDVGGVLPPFGNLSNQARQKPCDESSLSESLTSDEMGQLEKDVRAVRTQLSSQERVPETPTRPGNVSLSGSHSSHSHGRPRSQANTASRLIHPPETVSSHFDQSRPSPAARSKNSSRQHTPGKLDHGREQRNDSSQGFDDQAFSVSKGSYHVRGSTKDAWGPPEHGQSQKRKLNFDQDVPSKRQRTPSQCLSQRLSPGSRSYSPHHSQPKSSRPSDSKGSARTQASPSFPSVSSPNDDFMRASGSSDNTRHSSNRTPYKPVSKARNQQSSTSRSSAPSRTPRLYGRHQTRSKTQETDRFDQEIRGG